jgi:hypothetical protein
MPRPRSTVLVAAVGGALVLTGVLTGASSADPPQAGAADLSYSCAFPAGTVTAAVHLAATVPGSATAGSTVRAAKVAVTLKLPATAVTAASLTGAAALTLTATQGGHRTAVSWPGLTVPATKVPATGTLTLTATAPSAAIPVTGTGDLTLAPGDIGLAAQQKAADGSPASPPGLAVPCHPAAGAAPVLARISVPAGSTSTSPASTTTAAPSSTAGAPAAPITAPPPSAGPLKPAGVHRKDDGGEYAPPWCTDYVVPPDDTQECAYLVGFSNVKKLGGAAEVGLPDKSDPGGPAAAEARLDSEPAQISVDGDGNIHVVDHTTGTLTVPKSTGTFLSFRFVPTTADLHLTQVGRLSADSDITDVDPYPETTTITSQMALRIDNVKVNGAPLDVGDNCHAATPLQLNLVGVAPSSISLDPGSYTLQSGGPLSGSMTIPRFAGCGTHEDLDPLMDALISGPDNDLKMTQGTLCFPASVGDGFDDSQCPPVVPTPQH